MADILDSHMDLAKAAKSKAIIGQHKKALALYREALQHARQQNAHSIIMRHYSECALESMEQLEQYDQVESYCIEAIKHYEENPPESDIAKKDLAYLHQRLAFIYLKKGIKDQALTFADCAQSIATAINLDMPLLPKLKNWASSALHMDVGRILQEQKRHHYFTVRKESKTG